MLMLVLSCVWLLAAPWTVAHQAPLCPRNFPGKNTGEGCHFLPQGIFPIQEWNLCLLHHLGSPYIEARRKEIMVLNILLWIWDYRWLYFYLYFPIVIREFFFFSASQLYLKTEIFKVYINLFFLCIIIWGVIIFIITKFLSENISSLIPED